MAFPSGQETTTTLASFIPAVWGEKINDFYKYNLNLASFFTDRSAELKAGGSVLYTPNLTEMTANAVSVGTAVNTMAALTIFSKTYTLAVNEYRMSLV